MTVNTKSQLFVNNQIARYQAQVIAKALEVYLTTGHFVNAAYKPKSMLAMAARITGRNFKQRDYYAAACALRELAQ